MGTTGLSRRAERAWVQKRREGRGKGEEEREKGKGERTRGRPAKERCRSRTQQSTSRQASVERDDGTKVNLPSKVITSSRVHTITVLYKVLRVYSVDCGARLICRSTKDLPLLPNAATCMARYRASASFPAPRLTGRSMSSPALGSGTQFATGTDCYWQRYWKTSPTVLCIRIVSCPL